MTDPNFHDGEIRAFIQSILKENITANHLRIRFREEITVANLTSGTASQRRALRHLLEAHNATCERDTGDFIQNHLLLPLNHTNNAQQEMSISKVQAGHSALSHALSKTAKRDFPKATVTKTINTLDSLKDRYCLLLNTSFSKKVTLLKSLKYNPYLLCDLFYVERLCATSLRPFDTLSYLSLMHSKSWRNDS